jgi:hypothetical protein
VDESKWMSASTVYTNAHPEATAKMMADATGVSLEIFQKTAFPAQTMMYGSARR